MITAQDIREKTFEKSRLNGYEMAAVDDFLEELADEIGAAQKENTVLKSKMKVLVDKIEEYRANEEALNMAILSAQKLAVQIEADARKRAAALIAEADEQVKAKVGSIEEQTEIEKRRLAEASAATAKFFDSVRTLCNAQLQKLDSISSDVLPPENAIPSADVEDAIRSIEDTMSRGAAEEPAFPFDLGPAEEDDLNTLPGFDSTQSFTV